MDELAAEVGFESSMYQFENHLSSGWLHTDLRSVPRMYLVKLFPKPLVFLHPHTLT